MAGQRGDMVQMRQRSVVNAIRGPTVESSNVCMALSQHAIEFDERNTITRKLGHFNTLTWDEIEPWQQDNHFIIRGYRPPSHSYWKSIQSLTYAHNQTINVWSHLLGAIVFVLSAVVVYRIHVTRLQQATTFDLVLFGEFYFGLITCLISSSAFHTFGNHSDTIHHSFLLGDLVGIVLLTTASFYPGVYYGFYCEPELCRLYWTMVIFFFFFRI
jgi:adiponectin receptor